MDTMSTWRTGSESSQFGNFQFGATKKRPMISHKPKIYGLFSYKSGSVHYEQDQKVKSAKLATFTLRKIKLSVRQLDFRTQGLLRMVGFHFGNLPHWNCMEWFLASPKMGTCQKDTVSERTRKSSSQSGKRPQKILCKRRDMTV